MVGGPRGPPRLGRGAGRGWVERWSREWGAGGCSAKWGRALRVLRGRAAGRTALPNFWEPLKSRENSTWRQNSTLLLLVWPRFVWSMFCRRNEDTRGREVYAMMNAEVPPVPAIARSKKYGVRMRNIPDQKNPEIRIQNSAQLMITRACNALSSHG